MRLRIALTNSTSGTLKVHETRMETETNDRVVVSSGGGARQLAISRIQLYSFEPVTLAKMTGNNGLTKSECLCIEEPACDEDVDEDAHIVVPDWRLHKVQSPIELNHDDTNHYDHFEPLEFHGHWDQGGDAYLTNTGSTAKLTFDNREMPMLCGGPLHEDQYIFEQLHFHWGDDDHSGCEHMFEGQIYSMEAHAVHYNKKYGNFQDAADKHDGLAVVAFFLKATDDDEHPCFNKMTEAVKKIVKINTTTSLPSDCLTWIKEDAQCKGYYTYQGSLTTEPYTESVTWILYTNPIHVNRKQVSEFRNMNATHCEQHNITKNVRPIQTPPEHKKLEVIYARSHRKSSESDVTLLN